MAEEILSISHLMKRFGDQTVLKDISLGVREGEVIVVIGPSGCGKSTFLRCINALEEIQGGEIRLKDAVISRNNKTWRRSARGSEWCFRTMNCSRI